MKPKNEDFNKEYLESVFNGSFDSINRINYILVKMNEYSERSDVINWHKCLMTYYKELVSMFEPEEIEKSAQMIKDGNLAVASKSKDTFQLLWDLEIYLRTLQQRHGLNQKVSNDEYEDGL